MKKIVIFLALVLATIVQAQTLNVKQGTIVYQFPAAQTGDMTYADGTTLTIMGKSFTIADIDYLFIDETEVADNTVTVAYSGSTATLAIAGNIARYVTPTVNGAHVSIVQASTDEDNAGEITYTLSGTSTDGEFYIQGSYKSTVELNGLTLTNSNGAAVNIQNGKRINISVKKDTENTLTDCSSGEQKGCLIVKGHAEFKGQGTLNVYGKTGHGIKTGEYMSQRKCTINVLSAVGDGVHANEYFLMESGELNISGVGDDGLQVELDGTASTGELTDHEGEDSGNCYIEDGTVNIIVTGAATKGIKADGDMKISGGTLDITTKGNGTYDSTERDAKGGACLSADGNMAISGGTLALKNTGSGGKCIKADGTLTLNDGTVTATNTGSKYSYSSSYTASAKAVKAGSRTQTGGSGRNATYSYSGGIVVNGGTLTASASSHEAIESKSTIDINGGYVYAVSTDDAINSASTFTISGGFVMGNSTGNDGLDANGNFYVKGGTVFAIAARSPEVGIDANTEGGYKLYLTGGNVIAIGGLESGSSLTQSCYKASSYTKGSWYGLYNNGTLAAAFKVPSNSSMGSGLVVSTSGTTTLKSGISVAGGATIWNGFGNEGGTASVGSSVNLSSYTGGGGGGGGWRW